MSSTFPQYHKINSIQKRHTEGDLKGRFTGEWVDPTIAYLQDAEWVWREKIDGTNIRIQIGEFDDGNDGYVLDYRIGGRTDNAQIPGPLGAKLHEIFGGLDDAIVYETFDEDNIQGCNVYLYGEGYGAGIQKGGAYGPVNFILFDVKINNTWLPEAAVTSIACALGLGRVPLVGRGTLNEAIALVKSGKMLSAWPDVTPEGIVALPAVPLFDQRGNRVVAKVKAVDFK